MLKIRVLKARKAKAYRTKPKPAEYTLEINEFVMALVFSFSRENWPNPAFDRAKAIIVNRFLEKLTDNGISYSIVGPFKEQDSSFHVYFENEGDLTMGKIISGK